MYEDYEEMILSNQEDNYDGLTEHEDVVTISILDITLGRYVKVKTLTGTAAQEYCYEQGIR